MKGFDTMTEALSYLRGKGYIEDFNLRQDCIECRDGKYKLSSKEFKIDEVFRFEGDSDPADESILYAISSKKDSLKGVLINGYGIYSDTPTNEMAEKLELDRTTLTRNLKPLAHQGLLTIAPGSDQRTRVWPWPTSVQETSADCQLSHSAILVASVTGSKRTQPGPSM